MKPNKSWALFIIQENKKSAPHLALEAHNDKMWVPEHIGRLTPMGLLFTTHLVSLLGEPLTDYSFPWVCPTFLASQIS